MKIDIVVNRHPDRATETDVFIDGELAENSPLVNVVDIDPGAGWTEPDWAEARDDAVTSVHPLIAEFVCDLFDDAPRGYITAE